MQQSTVWLTGIRPLRTLSSLPQGRHRTILTIGTVLTSVLLSQSAIAQSMPPQLVHSITSQQSLWDSRVQGEPFVSQASEALGDSRADDPLALQNQKPQTQAPDAIAPQFNHSEASANPSNSETRTLDRGTQTISSSSNLVISTPSSLVIKGRKGGFWFQREVIPLRRNITLRFINPPDSVTVYVSDLKDPHADKIYSTEYIACEEGSTKANPVEEAEHDHDALPCTPAIFEVDDSGLFSMHVHFRLHLEDDARKTLSRPPSGEFNGELLIIPNYTDNPDISQDIVIPILLRVQDGWLLPLLILLVGVAMGMAVSAYSGGGKLSDEVTVGLNRLQAQIDRYRHEAQSFAIRAETYIADAQAANQAQQLEEAQQAVNQANRIWRKWYRQRTEWKAQFGYHAQLAQDVQQELDFYPSLYLQTIGRTLDDMLRKAPEEFSDPGDLRLGLQDIANQLREYGQVKISWNQLKVLVNHEFEHIGEVEQKTITTDVGDIKQMIDSVVPSDREGIDTLKTQLSELIERMKSLSHSPVVPSFESTSDVDSGESSALEKRMISKLVMIPTAPASGQSSSEAEQIDRASKTARLQNLAFWPDADGRLRTFYISSYIGSVVMLASLGFSSLYVDNPIFGANFFADYFSLVAWGFGAEATRDTVTKVVRKTDETKKD